MVRKVFMLLSLVVLMLPAFIALGTQPVDASHLRAGSYAITTTSLNMRHGASSGYGVKSVIPSGARVYVNAGPYSGHWYKVTYKGITGYSYGYYLRQGTASSGGTSSGGSYATTTTALNLRAGPGTNYYVKRVIPAGGRVYINGGPYSGWYKVTYGGTTGYVSGSYLRWGSSGSGSTGTGSSGSGYGKLIVVDLSQQYLYAYRNGSLILRTPVTTGRPGHRTPTGSFSVMAKFSPYRFVSPYPSGSEGYYSPFWAQYAIRFRTGGYYLHDNPYRPYYGPGTNYGHYDPDGVWRTGSLGCVNTPYWAIRQLYSFVDIGTPVRVQP